MKIFEIKTTSPSKTKTVARFFARELLKSDFNKKGALVIALEGELGSGKTTFTQGFSRGLGIHKKVLSPTFVIMKRFSVHGERFKNFFHIDAYRLKNGKEMIPLGWKDIIKDTRAIILVEWAENIKNILPKNRISISFDVVDKNGRTIKLKM